MFQETLFLLGAWGNMRDFTEVLRQDLGVWA
jgi:hypothetical protein